MPNSPALTRDQWIAAVVDRFTHAGFNRTPGLEAYAGVLADKHMATMTPEEAMAHENTDE